MAMLLEETLASEAGLVPASQISRTPQSKPESPRRQESTVSPASSMKLIRAAGVRAQNPERRP